MTNVPYKPEEQALKRIEEQQRAEIQREPERKVVEAKPASGSTAFRPEPTSENEKFKLAVGDKQFGANIEAQRRLQEARPAETPAAMKEQDALDDAARRLQHIAWLKPEEWRKLDNEQKAVALNTVGRELQEVYHHPNPPLIVSERGDRRLQGEYSDDDYWIFMNRAAEADGEKKLLGDDPVLALRTYAHEWRHSYQFEQATRWEKPQFRNLVDDPDQAMRWSWNIRDYKEPPGETLALQDYTRYMQEFHAYETQPVEADAKRFADELVRRVYGE
ncbi:MAG: hypothetical protein ACETWR_21390 [Anaerolineae bacterium]